MQSTPALSRNESTVRGRILVWDEAARVTRPIRALVCCGMRGIGRSVIAVGIAAVLSVIALGACGGRESASPPDPTAFACNPSDESRPDKAQREIAGYIPPPLPRRSCTLPQRGCTASATGGALPPPPGVRVASVTARSIHVVYNVGSELDACQPVQLVVGVDTSIDSLPPWGQN
jgi:hypothetical protein